jgi:hypothetical protein
MATRRGETLLTRLSPGVMRSEKVINETPGRAPMFVTGTIARSHPLASRRSVAWALSLAVGIASCSSSGPSNSTGTGGGGGGSSPTGTGGQATGGRGGSGGGGTGGQPNPDGKAGTSGGSGGAGSGGSASGGSAGNVGGHAGSSSGGAGSGGAAGSSGGGTSGLASPVTMNDVSILFPLGTAADYSTGHLRADSPGSRGALFPASVFQKLPVEGSTPSAGIGGLSTAPYANMRLVALRLDPCFGDLHPSPTATTCRNQLRLVFQEINGSGSAVTTYDSGVHALYSITREELLAMVNEIVRLREAAGGQGGKGPLAPHVLMVTQGLSGSFSTAVQKLILKYAGEQNLVRATGMTAANAGFQWQFFGFDVTGATPTASPIKIPTLAMTGSADSTSEIFFRGFQTSTDPVGMITPHPTGPDDFSVLADVPTALALPAADQAKLANALARVDNPTIYTPDTVDCVRCHTATPLGQNVARDRLRMGETSGADAFKPDGHWVTADEMKTTDFTFNSANLDTPLVNVHAFSYANALPAINQRTVNETAAVVQFLNDAFYRAK